MQIKVFTMPIVGGEHIADEMNLFLRSKKVLQVEHHLIQLKTEAFWSFYIKYVEDLIGDGTATTGFDKAKIDYQAVLDEASFKRYSQMREIRLALAKAENIPAYTILTNGQMAELAKIEDLSIAKMQTIKGFGEKTIEKYGKHFMTVEI
jgi:superfamily II DNA helicase RecQ